MSEELNSPDFKYSIRSFAEILLILKSRSNNSYFKQSVFFAGEYVEIIALNVFGNFLTSKFFR